MMLLIYRDTLNIMHLGVEFKFKDKWWTIDATNEDSSFGHLINHSRKLQNCRPAVEVEKGKPYVYFIATCDILPNTEI